MTKATLLKHWESLEPNQNIVQHFTPKEKGGRSFGACGIRIDGNPQFIDAVLSRLQDLLVCENAYTRLAASRSEVNTDFKDCPHAEDTAEVCYIRLEMRGKQAQAYAGILASPKDMENTNKFAKLLGLD